ncbi:hypothetical protein [Dactylosporangium sp. NPDC049140]|uniref:hypothetical protein n=1 Tax=Dactylosporangium sp. NPDC049140 TaxID=3155647 RepID=UPI0033CAC5A7
MAFVTGNRHLLGSLAAGSRLGGVRMTGHMDGRQGSGAAYAGEVSCPGGAGHAVRSVAVLYGSGVTAVGFSMRWRVGGIRGSACGSGGGSSWLADALAPPAALASWRRPMLAAIASGMVGILLALGMLDDLSQQSVAAVQLCSACAGLACIVSVGMAVLRWRRVQRVGGVYAMALNAWHRAVFCLQCGHSWVPGVAGVVPADRRLGLVLVRRAATVSKAEPSR